MKPSFPNTAKTGAMTLIEVLVVIAIIVVVLAYTAIPINRSTKSKTTVCMNNLHLIGSGYFMWSEANDDKFPWQVPVINGGTEELIPNGQAFDHFLVLSNYPIQPTRLVCPTDNSRSEAEDYEHFSNRNLSYFADLVTRTNSPTVSILAGDRHLQADGQPLKPGLFAYSRNITVGWTHELHSNSGGASLGVLLFADGHGETKREQLTEVFQRGNLATNLLVIP